MSFFGAGTGKVHINDSVCASLVVDPKSLNATVTLIIDGAVLYKDTFSVYDLADVCVPIQVRTSHNSHLVNTNECCSCVPLWIEKRPYPF